MLIRFLTSRWEPKGSDKWYGGVEGPSAVTLGFPPESRNNDHLPWKVVTGI